MPTAIPIDHLSFILSRIQFGLTVGVHFLFPIATLGLGLYILIFEFMYVRTNSETYKTISTMGTKLLGIIFAVGVATGLIMPFSFGTNVAGFVEFSGNIFGVQLVLEVIIAFMLESVFLGILLFGRNKVSKGVYLMSVFFVFLGSHLSAFFIISVNSWMQTPFHSLATLSTGIPIPAVDGFHLEQVINGKAVIIQTADQIVQGIKTRAVLDNVWKTMFTPSWGIRFIHTVFACWVTGSVIFAAIAAGLFIKKKHLDAAKIMLRLSVIIGFITSLAMPLLGHFHLLMLGKWQPVENAAMEGTFKTQKGAPLYALGWVDPKTRKTYGFGLPGVLSFLDSGRFDAQVEGLDDMLEKGRANLSNNGKDQYLAFEPPLQALFQTFHIMVFLGIALLGVFGLGLFLLIKKKWEVKPWIWKIFIIALPLPFLASELGWISVEIGRQPWLIYGLFKTIAGISIIPSSYVAFSLIVYSLVYVILFLILRKWIPKIIKESLA